MATHNYTIDQMQVGKNYFDRNTMYRCESVNQAEKTAVFAVFVCDNGEALQTGTKTLCEADFVFEH